MGTVYLDLSDSTLVSESPTIALTSVQVGTPSIPATLIGGNTNYATYGAIGFNAANWYGGGAFLDTAASHTLGSVWGTFRRIGNISTKNFVCIIWSDKAASDVLCSALASSSIVVGDNAWSATSAMFTFSPAFTLVANTRYHFTFSPTNTADTTNYASLDGSSTVNLSSSPDYATWDLSGNVTWSSAAVGARMSLFTPITAGTSAGDTLSTTDAQSSLFVIPLSLNSKAKASDTYSLTATTNLTEGLSGGVIISEGSGTGTGGGETLEYISLPTATLTAEWSASNPTSANWDNVNEDTATTEYTTYNWIGTTFADRTDRFTISPLTAVVGTIDQVSVILDVTRQYSLSAQLFELRGEIRLGSTWYDSAIISPASATWDLITYTWPTNPETSGAWTSSSITGINGIGYIGNVKDIESSMLVAAALLYVETTTTGVTGDQSITFDVGKLAGETVTGNDTLTSFEATAALYDSSVISEFTSMGMSASLALYDSSVISEVRSMGMSASLINLAVRTIDALRINAVKWYLRNRKNTGWIVRTLGNDLFTVRPRVSTPWSKKGKVPVQDPPED